MVGLLLLASLGTFAQKIGLQFYQGMSQPQVQFSGTNGELNYDCHYNGDTRIGLFFGDLKKLSVSTLLSASTVQASAVNSDLSTSFTHSTLKLEEPSSVPQLPYLNLDLGN